jgi:hypothetical protein
MTTLANDVVDVGKILADLYASGINISLQSFWDCGYETAIGYHVALGDEMNGWDAIDRCDSLPEAAIWLRDKAIELYPTSVFAVAYRLAMDPDCAGTHTPQPANDEAVLSMYRPK